MLSGWRSSWPLENYNLIAGLPFTGMTTPFVHEDAVNGDIFQTYVEHVFVPTLSPGDIVVLDNLPAHKVPRARKSIEQVGARSLDAGKRISVSFAPALDVSQFGSDIFEL